MKALNQAAAAHFTQLNPVTTEWTIHHREPTGLLMVRAPLVCIVAHYGETAEDWQVITTSETFEGNKLEALEQAARNLAEVRGILISLHASCCA